MKKIFCTLIIFVFAINVFALDVSQIELLFAKGQFQQAYDTLISEFNKEQPQADILWRIGRYYYEIADKKPSKKEIISVCDAGLLFLEPYLENSIGDDADRARVVQWYDVLLSRRGQAKGIKESLNRIPDFFAYADKAIKICPTIPEPYHLKAMIDKELPGMFGGDKVRMGQNFMKAIENGQNVIVFLVDAAGGFISRNWDANKKAKNGDTFTPKGISDKEFAKQLLNQAFDIAKNKSELTAQDNQKIDEAKELIKKVQ